MIGKIFAHLLGNMEGGELTDTNAVENENCEDLLEFEDGEWVIINVHDNRSFTSVEVDPLENLLIEHPSMSVYQMRHQGNEEEDLSSDEEEVDSNRPVSVRRHVSWRLAAWGIPVPCSDHLLSAQRARVNADRRKLTRCALHRQNLSKIRHLPSERRYGHYKQPSQRLYNY
ncbi:tumor protein p53-inducible nuclear protein 1 [Chanos chanos]|uniref:Tumor protein p53-inducible nuclear protein 1 n=1 Tax=Chanos chanos TaxID=29144 RepID=A0A6J2UP13_CHACN|nr:tumor protein p53-inducible nuclear protein 1-like [Chanos chanos]